MTFSFGKVNIKGLAQQCGRSRSFMGRVLSGEKGPSVDTLHRMSRYFNLSMDETYEILKRIRHPFKYPKVSDSHSEDPT
jgi:transcriptional regulator with XRE-family HTH domain